MYVRSSPLLPAAVGPEVAGAGPLPGCVLTFDARYAVRQTFEMTVAGNQADHADPAVGARAGFLE
jgi:hypothetical protein